MPRPKLSCESESIAIVSNVAGSKNDRFADGNLSEAKFCRPMGMTMGVDDIIIIADRNNNKIRCVDYDANLVKTIAGCGDIGVKDGPALDSKFYHPTSVAHFQNLIFVTDSGNHSIRVIDTLVQRVTTLSFSNGDSLSNPTDVAIDYTENKLILCDCDHHCVVSISLQESTFISVNQTIVAGSKGQPGNTDGPLGHNKLSHPYAICVSRSVMYLTERSSHRVRSIDPSGVVTTIVGWHGSGYVDGSLGLAKFSFPSFICVSLDGIVFVADEVNNSIRSIDLLSGKASTIVSGSMTPCGVIDYRGGKLLITDINSMSIKLIDYSQSEVYSSPQTPRSAKHNRMETILVSLQNQVGHLQSLIDIAGLHLSPSGGNLFQDLYNAQCQYDIERLDEFRQSEVWKIIASYLTLSKGLELRSVSPGVSPAGDIRLLNWIDSAKSGRSIVVNRQRIIHIPKCEGQIYHYKCSSVGKVFAYTHKGHRLSEGDVLGSPVSLILRGEGTFSILRMLSDQERSPRPLQRQQGTLTLCSSVSPDSSEILFSFDHDRFFPNEADSVAVIPAALTDKVIDPNSPLVGSCVFNHEIERSLPWKSIISLNSSLPSGEYKLVYLDALHGDVMAESEMFCI